MTVVLVVSKREVAVPSLGLALVLVLVLVLVDAP